MHGLADFAVGSETTYAGSVTRTWIDDNKGPLEIVDYNSLRRVYFHDTVVHWRRERSAVKN